MIEKRFITEKIFKETFGDKDIIGIEIGSAAGGWTAYTLLMLPNIKRLYCIDPWKHYDNSEYEAAYSQNYHDINRKIFEDKMKAEFSNRDIVILPMTSDEAINKITDKEVDFVFIDGHHGYEYIKNDIKNYYPLIRSGGIICGHDYLLTPGVSLAVNQAFSTDELHLGDDFTWWVFKK